MKARHLPETEKLQSEIRVPMWNNTATTSDKSYWCHYYNHVTVKTLSIIRHKQYLTTCCYCQIYCQLHQSKSKQYCYHRLDIVTTFCQHYHNKANTKVKITLRQTIVKALLPQAGHEKPLQTQVRPLLETSHSQYCSLNQVTVDTPTRNKSSPYYPNVTGCCLEG